MAAKNKNGKIIPNWKDPAASRQSSGFKRSEFVQYELTKEQAASCKEWALDSEALFEQLHKMVEGGFKVTFRTDTRNNANACWIIAPDEGHCNSGQILSGRGSTPAKALKQCIFKDTIFQGDWPSQMTKDEAELIDD